jgi:hypothetical protein
MRFAMGGVAFELLAPDGSELEPGERARRHCVPAAGAPVVAQVSCAVRRDPTLPATLAADQVSRRALPGAVEVCSRQMVARVERVASGRYMATARVAPGEQALEALLRGLSAELVAAEGGLLLHASGLDLDGAAVLFVGPSRAGKSTATVLAGACFAYDHVAVVTVAGRAFAWGLPGGTRPAAPEADAAVLPLRAILRVRRGEGRPELVQSDPVGALFVLRESVESSDFSEAGEQARLHAVAQLAALVHVGEIRTVLGQPLGPLLRGAFADADGQSPANDTGVA